jgi:hypothetical protein
LPINLDTVKAGQLAAIVGCQVGTFPFTYLGLPMSLTKPKVKDYLPLITKIERRSNATNTWVSMAGRLTLVNSTFSAMPIFAMCTLKLPSFVINTLTALEGIVYAEATMNLLIGTPLLHGRR